MFADNLEYRERRSELNGSMRASLELFPEYPALPARRLHSHERVTPRCCLLDGEYIEIVICYSSNMNYDVREMAWLGKHLSLVAMRTAIKTEMAALKIG